MDIVQNILLAGVSSGGEPVKVAQEIFEAHNFGDIVVASSDGVEFDSDGVVVKIPFYAEAEAGHSEKMLFLVEFLDSGADVTVYILS